MTLTAHQLRFLRQLAHHLKPVVILGNAGLTEAVVAEIERALGDHELIKLRVNAEDRDARRLITARICERTGSALIQSVGHVAAIYRAAATPRIQLP